MIPPPTGMLRNDIKYLSGALDTTSDGGLKTMCASLGLFSGLEISRLGRGLVLWRSRSHSKQSVETTETSKIVLKSEMPIKKKFFVHKM